MSEKNGKPMQIMDKGTKILSSMKPCEGCSPQSVQEIYVDPVCMMRTDDKDAYIPYEYKGKPYYFCNPKCLEKFKHDPDKYLAKLEHPGLFVEPPVCLLYTSPSPRDS